MAYPRDSFTPTNFIDVPDPNNPPVGAVEVDAAEMNKLGLAIAANRAGLNESIYKLNTDEFTANSPVTLFPAASESWMYVTSATWPVAGGIVKTVRHRASTANDTAISYDYQEFESYTGVRRKRHALTGAKATWQANHAYSVNDLVQPTVYNGYYYRATAVTGNSAGTEPATWRTDTTTFTDGGVTWVREGAFWGDWKKSIAEGDQVSLAGITLSGLLAYVPAAVSLTGASSTIPITSNEVHVTSVTGSPLTLTGTPIIADGQDGQILEIVNITTGSTFVLTSGASNNLRLNASTVTVPPLSSIKLVFSSVVGDWIQMNTAGVLPSTNPVIAGTLIHTPLAVTLTATTDTIQPTARNIHVTANSVLTLTSTPTIPDGIAGQYIELTNVGTNTFTLTHGTANNLRLDGGTNKALAARSTIGLKFSSTIGDWIQVTSVITPT